LSSACIRRTSTHGGLVDDQEIAVERVVVAALEPSALRIGLQKPVDRLCFDARRLSHALGGASGSILSGTFSLSGQ
jgi:hypothetical protein